MKGVIRLIWTADPLPTPLLVTTAVNGPAVNGLVEKVTVSDVLVPLSTVPTAPLLKTTVLLPGVVANPNPSITTVLTFAAISTVLKVITGVTVAT